MVPTLWRTTRMEWFLQNFEDSTDWPATLVFILEDYDTESIKVAKRLREDGRRTYYLISNQNNPNKAINFGYRNTTEPFLCFTGDDVEFQPGWLNEIMRHFATNPRLAVVTSWDGTCDDEGKSLYCFKRSYIDQHGTIDEPGMVFHEGYSHTFCDTEFFFTARYRGVYQHARDSHVIHHNPALTYKYNFDRTSAKIATPDLSINDKALYESRRGMFNGGF